MSTNGPEESELLALREHLDDGVVPRIKQLEWACQATAAYYMAVRMKRPRGELDELLGVSIVALEKAGFRL